MAWTEDLVIQLRIYIQDTDSSSWTDLQLQQFIAVATIEVENDLSNWGFTDYTVGYASDPPTISPDPTTKDDIEGNLIVLKAACILAQGDMKKQSTTAGIKIVDDKSTIDTSKMASNLETVANSACSSYQMAMEQYKKGITANTTEQYSAILPPYSKLSKEG